MSEMSGTDASGISSEQRGEELNTIRAYMQNSLEEFHVAGAAVAVVKDGEVIFQEGFGVRDMKQGLPVTKDTLFAIGSSTKAFTTMSVAMLVDDGKLDWDTPVASYLPEFKLHDKYASDHATLRDLATHRVGLPRHDMAWYKAPFSREELLQRLVHLPFTKPFRTTFQYQNLMYMTLGCLAGKVSGLGWEDFVKSRIFTPLGMHRSNFSVYESQQDADFAKPYKVVNERIDEMPFANIDAIGPAGSVNSSVAEMAAWVQFHLGEGRSQGNQLVSENNLSQMYNPHIAVLEPTLSDRIMFESYGLGWFTEVYAGHHVVHHGGNIDGFSAIVAMVPKEQLGVVVLTNQQHSVLPRAAAYTIIDTLLGLPTVDWNTIGREYREKIVASMRESTAQKDTDRIANTHPSHGLSDYVGEFEHPGYGEVSIALMDDNLWYTHHSQDKPLVLEHYHYDVFTITVGEGDMTDQLKVQFHTNLRGQLASLHIQFEPMLEPFEFVRKALPPTEGTMETYLGDYDLAGTVITVALRGEHTLVVTVPGQPTYELVPASQREFNIKGLPGFAIEFMVDDEGTCSEVKFKQPNGTFVLKRC
jgi:CubicO group peptidase (beta-lactamase class C family)